MPTNIDELILQHYILVEALIVYEYNTTIFI